MVEDLARLSFRNTPVYIDVDDGRSGKMGKSKSLFIKEYNHILFNWLVAFSLVMVIVGRFVIKFILLEIGAWILFIFLETYTQMFWSPESLYYNPVWHGIVATWETLVYSPILDLDRLKILLACHFGILRFILTEMMGGPGVSWIQLLEGSHKSKELLKFPDAVPKTILV